MRGNLNIKGVWWISGNKDLKSIGFLRASQEEGIILELVDDDFIDINNHYGNNDYVSVFGISGSTLITIQHCFIKELKGGIITKIVGNLVIIGDHIENRDAIVLDSLQIEYFHLNNWLVKNVICNQRNDTEYTVTFLDESKRHFSYNLEDYNLSFWTHPWKSFSHCEKVEFKQKSYCNYKSRNGEKTFDDFLRFEENVRNFLTFCVDSIVLPTKIIGRKNKNELEFFYRLSTYPQEIRDLSFNNMMISFLDIENSFEEIFKKWLKLCDSKNLQPLMLNYFEYSYNDIIQILDSFLGFCKAVECYHLRNYKKIDTYNNSYLPKDDFNNLILSISKVIDESNIETDFNYKETFKNKINGINYYSLKDRLKEVFDHFKDYMKYDETLIEDIVNTRNFYTHFSENQRKKSKHLFDLRDLMYVLQCLIVLIIFNELSLPYEHLKKNNVFQYYKTNIENNI